MRISRSDVTHIADLSRLLLKEEEKEIFQLQLNSILDYVEKLNEIDTRGIEPTSHVLPLSNVYRDDLPKPTLPMSDALQNAPDPSDGFFRVPKIID